MITYKEIPKNTLLTVGEYRLVFKLLLLPNQIAGLIQNLQGIIEKTYNVVANKPIRIIDIYTFEINNEIYLGVEFELLKNPVPVALIVGAFLGLVGLLGSFLIFDKIESISKTPLAGGLGLTLGFGSIVIIIFSIFFIFKKITE